MASRLTDDEKREIRDFQLTSLNTIQHDIKKINIPSLVGYINWLLNIALFPLTFFKYKREISAEHQTSYNKLMIILNEVRDNYFKDKSVEPADLVLFMCGFEPVGVKPIIGIKMKPGTPLNPRLENTSQRHKHDFEKLQRMGRDFLGILSEFGPFNAHLTQIYNDRHPGSQPYFDALRLSVGEHYNFKFEHMISSLFITDDERRNPEFSNRNNSMYMTKLKTGRVMKLFGISDQEVASILTTLRGGGRRTSRRKQTKSRNPRKRKSTKQRRRKSMKYRKS